MNERLLKGFVTLLMVIGFTMIPIISLTDLMLIDGAPVSINDEYIVFNATEDLLFQEIIEPVDIQGEILNWEIDGEPGWIDFLNGSMYGTPGNDDVGWNNFTISVSTTSDEVSWSVSISVTNTNPEIIGGSIAPMGWEDQYYSSQFDLREEGNKWEVYLEMMGPWNVTWAQIGRNGTVYGTPRNVHVGNWTLNITLDDGNGGVAWYEYVVSVVNEPPKITVKDYGIIQEWVEQVIDFDCASEGDGATYYQILMDNFDGELDPLTGKFTFIPGMSGYYHGYIRVEALDFFGGSDIERLEIVINNSIPELTSYLPPVLTVGEEFVLDLNTKDERSGIKYYFIDKYIIFSDFSVNSQFLRHGRLSIFPWNKDVGDHSFLFYMIDDFDAFSLHYWNFTVIGNDSFFDPEINVSVMDISTKRIQLEISVDGTQMKFIDRLYSSHSVRIYQAGIGRLAGIDFDPSTQRFVEIPYANISGLVNITVRVIIEHINGSGRELKKTIQVNIPLEGSDENESGGKFPWWQVIVIVMVVLILIFIITLIFVENISYAVQMAVFRGGTIDEEPILTLIHDKPGIQFREMLKYSNFSRRDLVSTLVSLEKNGNVRALPDGVLVRFYPTVGSFVDGPLALNRHQESIAKVLFERKKITHLGLSIETGISKKWLKRETSLMELKGALSERTGKEGQEYFLSSKQKKRIKEWMNGRR